MSPILNKDRTQELKQAVENIVLMLAMVEIFAHTEIIIQDNEYNIAYYFSGGESDTTLILTQKLVLSDFLDDYNPIYALRMYIIPILQQAIFEYQADRINERLPYIYNPN